MARDVGMQVDGLAALLRDLRRAGADVDDMKDVFEAISKRGERVMEGFVPARSGRLRASVRGNRAASKAVVRAGSARVPYAAPIQWGWPKRHIEPARFFEKTDAVMEPVAMQMLENGVSAVLRKNGF